MHLDRNNPHHKYRGKYALLLLRNIPAPTPEIMSKLGALPSCDASKPIVDFGDTPDTDFFVIRLKDRFAAPALAAYAMAAWAYEPEYANEVLALAKAAAEHQNKAMPT